MYRVIAVTNRKLSVHPFLEQIERVAERNPQSILLREKDLSEEEYQALAEQVLAICQNYQVELILHHYPAQEFCAQRTTPIVFTISQVHGENMVGETSFPRFYLIRFLGAE